MWTGAPGMGTTVSGMGYRRSNGVFALAVLLLTEMW
jgi:hypothetical protein